MALQKQLVPIIFNQGVNTKVDEKVLLPGSLTRLENAVFTAPGRLEKRNGYSEITLEEFDATAIADPQALAAFNNELTLYTSTNLYTYSQSFDKWVNKGNYFNVDFESKGILQNNLQQYDPQFFQTGGAVLYFWRDGRGTTTADDATEANGGSYKFSVADPTTESTFITDALFLDTPELAPLNRPIVKIATMNNKFYAFYEDTTSQELRYSVLDPAVDPTSWNTPTTFANGTGQAVVDVLNVGGTLYVGYYSGDQANQLTIRSLDSAEVIGAEVVVGPTSSRTLPDNINMTADSLGRISLVYDTAVGSKLVVSITNAAKTGTIVNGFNPGGYPNTVRDGHIIVKDSDTDTAKLYFYDFESAATAVWDIDITVPSAPAYSTDLYKQGQVILASKPFKRDDDYYFVTTSTVGLQTTYYIIRDDFELVGKFADGLAGKSREPNSNPQLTGRLPRVEEYDTDKFRIPNMIISDLDVTGGFAGATVQNKTGVQETLMDFNPEIANEDEVFDNNLYLTGGMIQNYDGDRIVEHGFLMFPSELSLDATISGSGAIAPGSYQYTVVYEYTDNNGDVQRSAPATPITVDVFGEWFKQDMTSTTVITGNNATFGGGGVIVGSYSDAPAGGSTPFDPVQDVKGTATYQQAATGSVNDYVRYDPIVVAASRQGETFDFVMRYIYDGNLGDVNVVVYDETNAAYLLDEPLPSSNGEPSVFRAEFAMGATTASISYGIQTKVENGQAELTYTNMMITDNKTNSQVDLEVSALHLTKKEDVIARVYRTEDAGTIFYKTGIRSTANFNTMPTDQTQKTLIVSDDAADEYVAANEQLYTTGGVLENDAPATASIIARYRNRVFLAGLEDRNRLVYSKERVDGSDLEFSGFLDVRLDDAGGGITALQEMDGKLIIFKKDRIFALTGQGPLNTGAQNDFNQPSRISADVGCTTAKSVVDTPIGLMFKSQKGIYLLDRGLNVQYIGQSVEQYNSELITSATLVDDKNQVRFTTAAGLALVYDYFVQQWSTFTNHSAKDADIYQDKYVILRSSNELWQEDASFDDAGADINMLLETGWMSFGALQGFQRVYNCRFLGDYKAQHSLTLEAAYNFDNTYLHDVTVDTATVPDLTPYQLKIDFEKQKCQSVRLRLTEVPGATAGENLSITGTTLEVGIKRGGFKMNQGQHFGTD